MASFLTKIAMVALVLVSAGYLCAQTEQTTTTTTTTFNGTLVDAGCYTTRTETRERSAEGATTTETKKTTERVDCPVTTTTTTFGLLTSEGQFVKFDDPSNVKVVEVVKTNKKWSDWMTRHEPVKVRVIGNRRGDVIVVESIR